MRIKNLSRRESVILGHQQSKRLDDLEQKAFSILEKPIHDFSTLVIHNILEIGERSFNHVAMDSIFDSKTIVSKWLEDHKTLKNSLLIFIFKNVHDQVETYLSSFVEKHKSININHDLKVRIKYNLDEFKKINSNYFDDLFIKHASWLEKQYFDNFRAGIRHENIAKELLKLGYKHGYNRAMFYVKTQIRELNSILNRQFQIGMGAEKYRWVTTLDGRQRPSHNRRHLKIFHWSNPPEDGHPGIPWGCRCSAVPIF